MATTSGSPKKRGTKRPKSASGSNAARVKRSEEPVPPPKERFTAPTAQVPLEPIDPRVLTRIWLGGFAFTVVLAVAVGWFFGPAPAMLVFVGAVFVAVISLFWSSIRTALGETPLAGADAFAIGAPRQEEEQKRAVLRALKDLEFERTVGKISEEDHRALVTQYRAQAKTLLRRIDELSQENRERAEGIMRERGVVFAAIGETGELGPAMVPIEPNEAEQGAEEAHDAGVEKKEADVEAKEAKDSSAAAKGAAKAADADEAATDEAEADDAEADDA